MKSRYFEEFQVYNGGTSTVLIDLLSVIAIDENKDDSNDMTYGTVLTLEGGCLTYRVTETYETCKAAVMQAWERKDRDDLVNELKKENKELKMEIQNLHQFIKKHIRGDIYE